ncbi:MAG: hypothetical protein MZW92_12385 [Comamonadaceae bacterium]|nr:hypothetical protein [Comamonadaceae bacterium]
MVQRIGQHDDVERPVREGHRGRIHPLEADARIVGETLPRRIERVIVLVDSDHEIVIGHDFFQEIQEIADAGTDVEDFGAGESGQQVMQSVHRDHLVFHHYTIEEKKMKDASESGASFFTMKADDSGFPRGTLGRPMGRRRRRRSHPRRSARPPPEESGPSTVAR